MGALATNGTEAEDFTVAESPAEFIYKEMKNICDDKIVTQFEPYFDQWIIEFLENAHNDSPGIVLNSINKEFDDHREILLSYIEKLRKAQEYAPKYATLSLEIEVEDLLTKISALIGKHYTPKYDVMRKEGEDGARAEIPNIAKLVETVRSTELSPANIAKVAKLFRNAYDLKPEDPAFHAYEEVVGPLTESIVNWLIEVLKVALNDPDEAVFMGLDDNSIGLLQSFVTEFHFLYDILTMRRVILKYLTGSEAIPQYSAQFFTPEFFKSLYEMPNKHYMNYFIFDEFIMSELIDPNLKSINTGAKKFFYDRKFPTLFKSSFTDLDLDLSTAEKDRSKDAARRRHNAKIERMAYIVYTFVREAGELPYKSDTDSNYTLKKMFDWVAETSLFDPETELLTVSEGSEPLPVKPIPPQHSLISPHEFRKNFIPVLYWICKHIEGCVLLNDKEDRILEQFKKFGNALDFEIEKDIKGSLPPKLVGEIMAKAVNSNVKGFEEALKRTTDLRNQLKKGPRISTNQFTTKVITNKIELSTNPVNNTDENVPNDTDSLGQPAQNTDKEPPKGTDLNIPPTQNTDEDLSNDQPLSLAEKEAIKKEIYEIFKKEVIDKVIPPGLTDPSKINGVQLELVLDKIESANEEIKDLAIIGFVKYITEHVMGTPKVVKVRKTFIGKVVKHFVNDFRSRIDFLNSLGFRNLLMYKLGGFQKLKVMPQDMSRKDSFLFYSHIYDLILFVEYAAKSHIAMLTEDPSKDPLDGTLASLIPLQKKQTDFFEKLASIKATDVENFFEMYENIKSNMISDAFLISAIHSFNLMAAFVDFFEYFKVAEVSNAQYLNYQSVFVNFYDFLLQLRSEVNAPVHKPYEYVLEELYSCLKFTESPEKATNYKETEAKCFLSHRKYAEMLYFVKLYMIKNNKRGSFDLATYPGSDFDTHSRMFLSFISQHADFDVVFQQQCKEKNTPICQASKIHTHLLRQAASLAVLDFNLDSGDFDDFRLDTPANKIILINGIEAMLIGSSSFTTVKDNQKFLGTLKVFKDQSAFSFEEEDIDALTAYFKRTFRKAVYGENEIKFAQLIQGILQGQEDHENPSKDSLKTFLLHDGVIFVNFLKVFLLFASTDQEYKRIAQVVIEQKMGAEVAKLNSPTHDSLIVDLISAVSTIENDKKALDKIKKDEEALKEIRRILQEKYAEINQICLKTIGHQLLATSFDPEKWKMQSAFTAIEEEIGYDSAEEEEKTFKETVAPILAEENSKDSGNKTSEFFTQSFFVRIPTSQVEEGFRKTLEKNANKVLEGGKGGSSTSSILTGNLGESERSSTLSGDSSQVLQKPNSVAGGTSTFDKILTKKKQDLKKSKSSNNSGTEQSVNSLSSAASNTSRSVEGTGLSTEVTQSSVEETEVLKQSTEVPLTKQPSGSVILLV